ncbi:hypothetical protein [Paenibacillus sp. A14]|uniref:hypothetical protein n=1 Tax=Paenibacillus sp. A14 TaxID=3119820 RepID=UPI002FE0B037
MGIQLTAIHYVYLACIAGILALLIRRRDTTIICVAGIFLLGLLATGTLGGSVSGIFEAFIFATKELMGTIMIISIVVAMSRVLILTGINETMLGPLMRFIRTPSVAFWGIGLIMMVTSFFFWPSPGVALIGAVLLPVALRVGLPALGAAVAMNLFGHGIALSGDYIIQGAPKLTADAAGLSTGEVMAASVPLVAVMGVVTTVTAYWLIRRDQKRGTWRDGLVAEPGAAGVLTAGGAGSRERGRGKVPGREKEQGKGQDKGQECKEPQGRKLMQGQAHGEAKGRRRLQEDEPVPLAAPVKKTLALLIPLLFLADVAAMLRLDLQGGEATALVGGTAVLILVAVALLAHRGRGLEKTTSYLIDGFVFGFKVFGPVIPIAAFFYLGDSAFTDLFGETLPAGSHGIVNDLGAALAGSVPLNGAVGAVTLAAVGAITGLDGSGFSGISLAGSVAQLFAAATQTDAATLTALGQIAAIWVGGGTLIPWALIPAAAICGVSPFELARRNLVPVLTGLAATTLVAICLL